MTARSAAILSPYLSAGIGYGIWGDVENSFNMRTSAAITADENADAEENGGLVFPLGGGLKFYLSERTSLGLDVNFRTDELGSDRRVLASRPTLPKTTLTYLPALPSRTASARKIATRTASPMRTTCAPTSPAPNPRWVARTRTATALPTKMTAGPDVAGLATLRGWPRWRR